MAVATIIIDLPDPLQKPWGEELNAAVSLVADAYNSLRPGLAGGVAMLNAQGLVVNADGTAPTMSSASTIRLSQVADATPFGRQLAMAANSESARVLIGAPASSLQLPAGGSSGQFLRKRSTGLGDAVWETVDLGSGTDAAAAASASASSARESAASAAASQTSRLASTQAQVAAQAAATRAELSSSLTPIQGRPGCFDINAPRS
jgi:hypothetical protein